MHFYLNQKFYIKLLLVLIPKICFIWKFKKFRCQFY